MSKQAVVKFEALLDQEHSFELLKALFKTFENFPHVAGFKNAEIYCDEKSDYFAPHNLK